MASSKECSGNLGISCQVAFCWEARRFSWPKGTSRESVESIYMKIMGVICVCEALGRLKKKKKKKKKKQKISSDSRIIERSRGRLATLNMLTDRVAVYKYGWLHKKA